MGRSHGTRLGNMSDIPHASQSRPLDSPCWQDRSWMKITCIKHLNAACLGNVQIKGWASLDVGGAGGISIYLLTCRAGFIP